MTSPPPLQLKQKLIILTYIVIDREEGEKEAATSIPFHCLQSFQRERIKGQ